MEAGGGEGADAADGGDLLVFCGEELGVVTEAFLAIEKDVQAKGFLQGAEVGLTVLGHLVHAVVRQVCENFQSRVSIVAFCVAKVAGDENLTVGIHGAVFTFSVRGVEQQGLVAVAQSSGDVPGLRVAFQGPIHSRQRRFKGHFLEIGSAWIFIFYIQHGA